VVLVFFCVRPLKSPWHPFIAGDGLGYYSYLPATFIYHDTDYEFKWFNAAYNANYVYSTFDNPEDNLLVKYGDKRINKYYQGLSFIWLPFFMAGHLCAYLFHYPADGFSFPYQMAIALASLFYLLLGLVYLRRLLLRLFNDQLAALVSSACVFYGTWLFTYAVYANSMSHVYSFTFITLFLYAVVSYFHYHDARLKYFLLALLFLAIAGCIRPLTALIVLVTPVFMPLGFYRERWFTGKFRHMELLVLLLAAGIVVCTLAITWVQTNSLLAYTYPGEKFYFNRSKFADTLFSYHIGLFVYVPLLFIALFGIPFLKPAQRIGLPLFFLFIVFLYSCWWYWPVTKRAVVDFYAIPAIWLAALIHAYRGRVLVVVLIVAGLTVIYFQFKSMQVRNGILDEYATYKEVFWRNFFRTKKASMYLVPPSTIIKKEEYVENFETPGEGILRETFRTSDIVHSGKWCMLLDPAHYLQKVAIVPYPKIFNAADGFRKVRFSAWLYPAKPMQSVHLFMQFMDSLNKPVVEVPFYLNRDDLDPGSWDYKEFGYEIVDTAAINSRTLKNIVISVWNVDAKEDLFLDDAKIELILTDRSFETIR
jgi:hypothetical protein